MNSTSLRLRLHSLRRALDIIWRADPKLTTSQFILALLQAMLPLLTLVALKQAVDAATRALALGALEEGWRVMLATPEVRSLCLWLAAGAGALGAQAILRAFTAWVSELHAMAVSDRVHALLHEKLTKVDLAFFENHGEQDRLHLVQNQAMTEPIRILGGLFQFLQSSISLLGVLVLLGSIHFAIPLALLAGMAPVLLVHVGRSRRLYRWRKDVAPMEREASYFHGILTGRSHAQEIRLYSHGEFCRQRFESVRSRLRSQRKSLRRFLISRELVVQGIMLAVLILLLAWLTRRLLGGALTLGGLAMAIQALQRGQAQASSLSATLADVYQSLLFMDAFEELLALPTQVATVREPRALARPLRGGIVFDNVSFIYPGTGHMVIRDLNLSIRPSEKLAIVGANGSGKTTLIKLLARLYDPTSGRILVDGIDLREIDVADWRRRIGLLFQDFGRYQLTAAENIWLGDGRRAVDDPAIAKAAEISDLGDTARHWPDGLETRLGRWLHDGLEPSGGQWQRIALARALFRQSEILVMDEPTSALDARARREMIRRFKALTEGRMALVASHRLALARWADRVLVLRDGALVESGAATELLGADGEFRRLFAEGRLTRDDD